MLLARDAVMRALVRRMVTRERLLEWETAAEAEEGARRTPVDRYLNWMPVLALGVGAMVWLLRPRSLAAAVPILCLRACHTRVYFWLHESPMETVTAVPDNDVQSWLSSALTTSQ